MTFSGLSYLSAHYLWWWISALVIGLIIGWSTFSRGKKSAGGSFPWILLLATGMVVAYLKLIPDLAGLWFDTAVLMATSYFGGCFLGGTFHSLFGANDAPIVAVSTPLADIVPTLAAVKPYQWQAQKDSAQKDGATVTLSGFAPSAEAKARIVASAKAVLKGATIIDRLSLASGAPTGLETLTGAAFDHLSKLDKGIASLVDSAYTLTGAASSEGIKTNVDTAASKLPAGFTLAKIDVSAPIVAVTAASTEADKPTGLTAPRGGVADDLKRIRGIGKQNEGRLHGLGIWHFDQIAAWTKPEIVWVGHFLAFPGRIEREDWVPQAKVLATGAETEFSKRIDKGDVVTSVDDGSNGQNNVANEGTRPAILVAPRNGKADDLKLIKGIGEGIEHKLNEAGIFHFDQIAQMSKSELTWVSIFSGYPGSSIKDVLAIKENWKGDAAILAVGGETDHSKSMKAAKKI